ncbi:MAG: acetyl/propionyl/methylcrotonyl-CoA carboxylase subunit alpha [Nocardioides sp.]
MRPPFDRVLVANRGEIAVRVMRTLRELDIGSVAVYSDADARARHVAEADAALRIGPAPATDSYLNAEAILAAAVASGAQAIHPGYGFLSENAGFAEACADAGVVLIGPPASAMRLMGDKIAAKSAAVAAGVPVVPGRLAPAMSDTALALAAAEIGFPVLVKPSAGGGGKGMRLVANADELPAALASARREAGSAFGDDTLFVERFVSRPRHIEVQVFADTHGNVVHLGERECSLQRRHQKIVEEAPSPLLDEATRDRIGASAAALASAVDYVGAGTVEFIVSADAPTEFFFMEMNTRLQVEHPVTELVTGLDLVAEQIRVATGRPLSFGQSDIRLVGHAVEARVYAEDPAAGFLPSGGDVLAILKPAGPHVRVDSGIVAGTEVGNWYDPMLAKVIAWGPDRATALSRLREAVADTAVLGVRTNLDFVGRLLATPEVAAGEMDTELVDRRLGSLTEARAVTDGALAAYAMIRLLELQPDAHVPAGVIDPWEIPSGWRLGAHRPLTLRVVSGAESESRPAEVRLWGSPDEAQIQIEDGPRRPAAARVIAPGRLHLQLDGRTLSWTHAAADGLHWLHGGGSTWTLHEARPASRMRAAGGDSDEIRSPMPGTVLAVPVASGDQVASGTPLVVVEAMKMEHSVTAPRPGRVTELLVRTGDHVTLGQHLLTLDRTPLLPIVRAMRPGG